MVTSSNPPHFLIISVSTAKSPAVASDRNRHYCPPSGTGCGLESVKRATNHIYSHFVTLKRLLKMGGNTEIVDMTACYVVTIVTVENIKLESYMDWPKEYSKTTQAVRDAAYKRYYVEAITRSVLLPGQVKTAYHDGLLTTDYYLSYSPAGRIRSLLGILPVACMQQRGGSS